MPALLELQRAVCRSLVAGEDAAAIAGIAVGGIAAADRLDIYRNTFRGTLVKALRLSHPAVHRLVGDDCFAAAAQRFAVAQPPRSACLDDYGAGFAGFLTELPELASLAYLPDVARLDWAVNRALHAPDAASLDAAALLGALLTVDPADHDRVRFVPHPSLGLLSAQCPADAIWRAVLARDDVALRAIDLADAPVRLLIQRLATGVDVQRLTESAWRFAHALCGGQPLRAVVELAREGDSAALLAAHLTAGRFIAFSVAAPHDGAPGPR